MRKIMLLLIIVIAVTMTACNKSEPVTAPDTDTAQTNEDENMNEQNRKLIASALGEAEDARNIRFILASLETIDAGTLQSAECTMEENNKVLDIVAEDGTAYRVYLNSSGSVDAIQNMDTNEWPVKSER